MCFSGLLGEDFFFFFIYLDSTNKYSFTKFSVHKILKKIKLYNILYEYAYLKLFTNKLID